MLIHTFTLAHMFSNVLCQFGTFSFWENSCLIYTVIFMNQLVLLVGRSLYIVTSTLEIPNFIGDTCQALNPITDRYIIKSNLRPNFCPPFSCWPQQWLHKLRKCICYCVMKWTPHMQLYTDPKWKRSQNWYSYCTELVYTICVLHI